MTGQRLIVNSSMLKVTIPMIITVLSRCVFAFWNMAYILQLLLELGLGNLELGLGLLEQHALCDAVLTLQFLGSEGA